MKIFALVLSLFFGTCSIAFAQVSGGSSAGSSAGPSGTSAGLYVVQRQYHQRDGRIPGFQHVERPGSWHDGKQPRRTADGRGARRCSFSWQRGGHSSSKRCHSKPWQHGRGRPEKITEQQGFVVPAPPPHIPRANERTVLQKLTLTRGLSLDQLYPAGKQLIDSMVAKGWSETV
jgi:hypothetical protein